MKKFSTLFCTCLFFIHAHAQILPDNSTIPFAPIGAKWYYTVTLNDNTEPAVIGYVLYESVKDTTIRELIFDRSCRIITATLFSPIAAPKSWGREIVYSSGEKIFYFDEGRFYPLFDYALAAGSTHVVRNSTHRGLFQYRNEFFDRFEYKIDSVKTVNIAGSNYKVQFPSATSGSTTNSWLINTGFSKDRENISILANKGDFFGGKAVRNATEEPVAEEFRCYEDNGAAINLSGKPCDFMAGGVVTSISQKEANQRLNYYSIGNTIVVPLTKNLYESVIIYDMNGRKIQEFELFNTAFSWDKTGVNSGLYLLHFSGKTQQARIKIPIQ